MLYLCVEIFDKCVFNFLNMILNKLLDVILDGSIKHFFNFLNL